MYHIPDYLDDQLDMHYKIPVVYSDQSGNLYSTILPEERVTNKNGHIILPRHFYTRDEYEIMSGKRNWDNLPKLPVVSSCVAEDTLPSYIRGTFPTNSSTYQTDTYIH